MTRVSLKEAYDNKDVVAQIYAIRDTAESAEDSAEQAVTTANTASEHVDALVPQVEGAVENANSASASAQASAQTVAGYENRLATVEDVTEDLSGDLNAVTLRVTTAEGQIVTIQGRVTALETADGQNVKINRINDYAVGLTGNQTNIVGNKGFTGNVSVGFLRTTGTDGYRRINIDRSDDEMGATPATTVLYPLIAWNDKNNNLMSAIYVSHLSNGTTSISVQVRNSDGSIKYVTVAQGDVI